ncbi:MAG: hypothetical protein WD604_16975, partial [Balneolaceae bacterium]
RNEPRVMAPVRSYPRNVPMERIQDFGSSSELPTKRSYGTNPGLWLQFRVTHETSRWDEIWRVAKLGDGLLINILRQEFLLVSHVFPSGTLRG